MSEPSTLSRSGTQQPAAALRTTSRTSTDRQGFFTGLDMAGAAVAVVMIWGPLAAGAFLGS